MTREQQLAGFVTWADRNSLNTAVLAAYDFDANKDLLAQLLALNHAVASRIEAGKLVTAPGVPKDYKKTDALITNDCIQP